MNAKVDKIAAMLADQCIDWNGEPIADEAETRNAIYCGQLRAILADRDALKTNLRHWREECGKLHGKVNRIPELEAEAECYQMMAHDLAGPVIVAHIKKAFPAIAAKWEAAP